MPEVPTIAAKGECGMTIRIIVADWLESHGYDGLCNNTALGFTNDPPLPKPPKAYKQGQWHPKLRHQRKRAKERP